MGELFDAADTDIEREESIIALLDAMAEVDADTDPYPVTEADLVEAQRLARLEFDIVSSDDTETVGSLDLGDAVAQITISQLENWLAQTEEVAVRTRGPVAVTTEDQLASGLTTAGYAEEVELDADVDREARVVGVSIQLTPNIPKPDPLVLTVKDSAGTAYSARITRYGLAQVTGIPIESAATLTISWRRPC